LFLLDRDRIFNGSLLLLLALCLLVGVYHTGRLFVDGVLGELTDLALHLLVSFFLVLFIVFSIFHPLIPSALHLALLLCPRVLSLYSRRLLGGSLFLLVTIDGVEVRLRIDGFFLFLLFLAHLLFLSAFLLLLNLKEGEIRYALSACHVVVIHCTDRVDMVQHLFLMVHVNFLLLFLLLAIGGRFIIIRNEVSNIVINDSPSLLRLLLRLLLKFLMEVEDVGLIDSYILLTG
jgi:hypothetical protein